MINNKTAQTKSYRIGTTWDQHQIFGHICIQDSTGETNSAAVHSDLSHDTAQCSFPRLLNIMTLASFLLTKTDKLTNETIVSTVKQVQ